MSSTFTKNSDSKAPNLVLKTILRLEKRKLLLKNMRKNFRNPKMVRKQISKELGFLVSTNEKYKKDKKKNPSSGNTLTKNFTRAFFYPI